MLGEQWWLDRCRRNEWGLKRGEPIYAKVLVDDLARRNSGEMVICLRRNGMWQFDHVESRR